MLLHVVHEEQWLKCIDGENMQGYEESFTVKMII